MPVERHAFATGVWLGAAQASLGLAVLIGVGASALVYFALLAGWIASGAVGATLVDRSRDPAHFVAALLLLGATRVLSIAVPLGAATLGLALAACVACGSYGGFFIASAGRASADRRAFLFRENNGFVVGFAVASALMFLSVRALDALMLLGSAALLATKVRAR